jgi:hypothetical protein
MSGRESDTRCIARNGVSPAEPSKSTNALLYAHATSVVAEVPGGYALSEFGRLRPLLERRV